MSKVTVRETLSAKVSLDSANGWKEFCRNNGISISAMLEVAGLRLANESHPPRSEERASMVEEARRVDIERRARK